MNAKLRNYGLTCNKANFYIQTFWECEDGKERRYNVSFKKHHLDNDYFVRILRNLGFEGEISTKNIAPLVRGTETGLFNQALDYAVTLSEKDEITWVKPIYNENDVLKALLGE